MAYSLSLKPGDEHLDLAAKLISNAEGSIAIANAPKGESESVTLI
jgi:hypothetical protein